MDDVRIIVERMPSEEEASRCANEEDLLFAARFGLPRRRAEFLAWRNIVRRELGEGVRLSYSPVGTPVVVNEDIYIGVSHCRDAVAVIISPRRCAVDIEPLARDFSKVAPRFISDDERRLSDDERLSAALWCAKETLYKYSGRQALDLKRNIRVESVDFESERIVGYICDGEKRLCDDGCFRHGGHLRDGGRIEMKMMFEYGCMVVYVG